MPPTVREFYEAYPYPQKSDTALSVDILPSSFDTVRHHCWAGHWPADRPFRALVAGGGTGDAVVSLGLSLRRRGIDGSIHYVDLSSASAAIARRRATHAGLDHVTFEVGPIEATRGEYDYIDLSGVLPIVVDPAGMLQHLASLLVDDGAIGVMSYGRLGRHGVEPFREMYQALAHGDDNDLPLARALAAALPDSNLLRRNPRLGRGLAQIPDVELADRLIAPHEFAYSVKELDTMCRCSGLAIRAFVPGLLYDPARLLRDASLRERLAALNWIDRAQVAENLQSDMNKHVFYAVKGKRDPMSVDEMLDRGGDAAVLLPRAMSGAALAAQIEPSGLASLAFVVDGIERRVAIRAEPGVRRFLDRVDGEPTVGEMRRHIGGPNPDATIRYMVRVLTAIEMLHIAIP